MLIVVGFSEQFSTIVGSQQGFMNGQLMVNGSLLVVDERFAIIILHDGQSLRSRPNSSQQNHAEKKNHQNCKIKTNKSPIFDEKTTAIYYWKLSIRLLPGYTDMLSAIGRQTPTRFPVTIRTTSHFPGRPSH